MTPMIDLPKGMRTWIWENKEDVIAALYCLMKDHKVFRACAASGMLMHYAETKSQEGDEFE